MSLIKSDVEREKICAWAAENSDESSFMADGSKGFWPVHNLLPDIMLYTPENFPDIKELLDYLKVENAVMVGWSMAGQFIVKYFDMFGAHRIKALGLIDCPLGAAWDEDWNAHGLKGFNMDLFDDHMKMCYNDNEGYCRFFGHMMYDGVDESKIEWATSEMMKTPPWISFAIYSDMVMQNGYELLEKIGKGAGIMTHCNAGTLATAKYGTALAPMYIALERGWDPKDMHVYCDETRPLLQGARLSAYEMQAAGIDTYLQCDNMASYTMKSGKIGIIFVGCDRVAANGDFANKIGTSGVAIIAKYYGIPFYVCAPSSTIDMTLESGDEIKIEQRKPEEVTEMWYKERMAPEGVGVVNPAFDVTDHSLVTGIITEKGIAAAPFRESFEKMGIKPVEKFVDKKQDA